MRMSFVFYLNIWHNVAKKWPLERFPHPQDHPFMPANKGFLSYQFSEP